MRRLDYDTFGTNVVGKFWVYDQILNLLLDKNKTNSEIQMAHAQFQQLNNRMLVDTGKYEWVDWMECYNYLRDLNRELDQLIQDDTYIYLVTFFIENRLPISNIVREIWWTKIIEPA